MRTRIEAAAALGSVGDPRLEDRNWITIPAGNFWMGAESNRETGRNYDAEAHDRESPVHEVRLKAFRIGRFPVTVQEFASYIDTGGYETDRYRAAGGYGRFQRPDGWEGQRLHLNRPWRELV